MQRVEAIERRAGIRIESLIEGAIKNGAAQVIEKLTVDGTKKCRSLQKTERKPESEATG